MTLIYKRVEFVFVQTNVVQMLVIPASDPTKYARRLTQAVLTYEVYKTLLKKLQTRGGGGQEKLYRPNVQYHRV